MPRSNRRATAAVFTATLLTAAGTAATVSPAVAVRGGQNTTVTDHPYAMRIVSQDGAHVCGGTLVAPTKVLTAAHCVAGPTAREFQVIGGRTEIQSTKGTVRAISSIKLHAKYTQGTFAYDAAVLTLAGAMPYATLPVAGPNESALYAHGKTAKAVGWGLTARDTNGTRLKSAVLTLGPLAKCEPFTEPGDSGTLKVCGLPGAGTTDSICRGDSGGPLIAGGRVIGVVSTGNKYCDTEHLKSVFTRTGAVAAGLGLPVG
ncbi:S1 family peptidase [Streptomyces sp. NPDC094448]|uniref:S1 family peptidase n=1 Tax=Streptomyces sp. NPDC094448 TaxID=3366063 RepID=UPI003819CC84